LYISHVLLMCVCAQWSVSSGGWEQLPWQC